MLREKKSLFACSFWKLLRWLTFEEFWKCLKYNFGFFYKITFNENKIFILSLKMAFLKCLKKAHFPILVESLVLHTIVMCCFSQRRALTLKLLPTTLKVLSITLQVIGFIILKRLSRHESRKKTFFTTTQRCVGFQENKSYLNYSSSSNFT